MKFYASFFTLWLFSHIFTRSEAASLHPDIPLHLVDGYTLISELGEGAFGMVFQALETSTGKTVAIKFSDYDSYESLVELQFSKIITVR